MRKVPRKIPDSGDNFAIYRERIGAWFSVNKQRGGVVAIHEGGVAIVDRTDLGVSDVADTRNPGLVVGLQDDVAEFFRCSQPAPCFDINLIGSVARNRGPVEDAGRNLEILRP